MHIYFSGIGGNGIGPLAEITKQAGYEVSGSDLAANAMTDELQKNGITLHIGQSGAEIAAGHAKKPIDWLVVSSAIPQDHPEVVFAKEHGIKITKRGPLLSHIITENNLQLIAVAGTHGKTTTTAMLVWIFQQLGKKPSYSIGSNIGFGPSGYFDKNSEFFIYEADEHDRNMLDFHPDITVIPSVDYDHPNTYPTVENYKEAFRQFLGQSKLTIVWQDDAKYLALTDQNRIEVAPQTLLPERITLAGKHVRNNAILASTCAAKVLNLPWSDAIAAVNSFPGTRRRFEPLAPNVYTDYAHHPVEIRSTLQLASELSPNVVVVYEPHQNIRQHQIADEYTDSFNTAKHVYWLPTYLTREDPTLSVLAPEELIAKLDNPSIASAARFDDTLKAQLRKHHDDGDLILFMGAGPIDDWAREWTSNLSYKQ